MGHEIVMTYLFFLEVFIATVGPFLIGWMLIRRYHTGWRPFLIGAATFILSQVVHIPLLYGLGALFTPEMLQQAVSRNETLFYILLSLALGLAAGVCEETARFLVLKYWYREHTWEKGTIFGAGHGGAECFLLLGLGVFVTLFNMINLRDANLATVPGISPEHIPAIQAHVKSFWGQPWWMPFVALLERFFVIIIQIALALMVMLSLTKKKLIFLGGAIFFHTALDALSVYGLFNKWPI